MRVIFFNLAVFQVCLASRLSIILPDSHDFESTEESFDSNSLRNFNKNVLGIGTNSDVQKNNPSKELFEKPKALVVISVHGLDDFEYDGRTFNFTNDFESQQTKEDLKNHFGDDMIHVDVNSSGIFGSPLFKRNVKDNDQTYSDNEDLQNMFILAKSIKEKDRRKANVVDYYRIHLDASNARDVLEKKQLAENIKRGIDTLQDAIKDSYGGKVIAEIYTHEKPSDSAEKLRVKALHKNFQTTFPRHIDYPALFAIRTFFCLCFIFAVGAMLCFMFGEGDMGKNSLVYRLSSARQKKD